MSAFWGWFVTDTVTRTAGEVNRNSGNALWGLALWCAVPIVGGWGASSNFGRSASPYGAIAAFLALLAFVLWRPHRSDFKLMMLNAVSWVLSLVMIWNVGVLLFMLLSGELKRQGLAQAWPGLVACLAYALGSFALIYATNYFVGWNEGRDMAE